MTSPDCYAPTAMAHQHPEHKEFRTGDPWVAFSYLVAGVPFYGSAPELADVPKIKTPLLIQSAEQDDRINAAWPAYESALEAAKVSYERHLYPGTQHGFHNDTTPRYDEKAAKLAWERTLAFLEKHLKGATKA